MAQEKYNGWTNYETWNVALWIDNDQGTYNMRNEWVQDAYRNAKADQHSTRKYNAAITVAEALKAYMVDNNPLAGQASCYSDLLGAALDEVNWTEIAGNWVDEIEDEEVSE